MVTAENGSALLHGAYGFIHRVRKGERGERERERRRVDGGDRMMFLSPLLSGRVALKRGLLQAITQ